RSAQRVGCSSRRSPPEGVWSKLASRPATPSWLGEPRCASSRIASSAARTFSASGWKRSSRQCASMSSTAQGPRARMPTVVCTVLTIGFARMAGRQRKHWGWGFADEQPPLDELRQAAHGFVGHLGFGSEEIEEPVALDDVALRAPRVEPPDDVPSPADAFHRVRFGLGCAYVDVVRGMRGEVPHPPDAVLAPRDEGELEA